MQSGRFGIKLLLTLTLSLGLAGVGCTLRKRQKAAEDKKDEQKVTIETPTPTPSANPASPTTTGTAQSSSPETSKQRPSNEIGIPAPKLPAQPNPQAQMDYEEFKSPTFYEVDPSELDVESTSPSRKRFTGFTDHMGRAYTDSGSDYLMPFLRQHQNQEPESQTKSSSLDFSHRITEIKLLDTSGSHYSIRVKYSLPTGGMASVKMVGPVKKGGRYIPLAVPEKGKLTPAADSPLVGELRCMDLAPSSNCGTYFLRLTLKKSDGNGVAEAIVRLTSSALRIRLPKINTHDPRIPELISVMQNSAMSPPTGKFFDTFEMQSFAVVNGRAEFSIRVMTNDGEYIYVSGPLISGFGDEPLSVELNREPNKHDPANASWAPASSGRIASFINSAQLQSNNGRGQIKIGLFVSEQNTQNPIEFNLTFTRHSDPVLDLNQASVYFQP